MKNYQTLEIGNMDTIAKQENGKIFLHDGLNLTSCEISVNSVPAGYKAPFNHKHIQNEEVYIILSGNGIMTIDNENVPLTTGTVIRVAPDAVRTMSNTGAENMSFICIQAKSDSLQQFGLGDGVLC